MYLIDWNFRNIFYIYKYTLYNFLWFSVKNTENISNPISLVEIRIKILCIFWKKKISSDIEQGRNLLLLHVYVPHESKYYQKNRKFDLLQGSKQKRTTSCNLLNLFCKKKNVILFSKRLVDNYSNCRVRKFKRDVLKKKRLEKIVLEGELLTLKAYNNRTKIWEHIFQ